MVDPDTVVCSMLNDWSVGNNDASKMASHFAPGAVYKPSPGLAPLTGQTAIRQFTQRILTAFDSVDIKIRYQCVQENMVMNERTDILRRRDKLIEVPAMGIFEVSNGLIVEWRDYSDMSAVLDGFNFGSKVSPPKTKGFWARRRGGTVASPG